MADFALPDSPKLISQEVKLIKIEIQSPKSDKMADFALQDSPKLISRKI